MAPQSRLSSLQPFDTEEIGRVYKVPINTNPHSPPDDILQLQTDVINVLENRVDITTFPPAYQQRIKNYYRFSGTVELSKYPVVAKRMRSTQELV